VSVVAVAKTWKLPLAGTFDLARGSARDCLLLASACKRCRVDAQGGETERKRENRSRRQVKNLKRERKRERERERERERK